ALAATLLRSIPFLPLALFLIIARLIGLLIVHFALFGELNPKKFVSEGANAFILLALVAGLLHVFT
ncbi:MAG: hypothetical protein AABX51_04825, partial [Nanoarchaeota archaeon]